MQITNIEECCSFSPEPEEEFISYNELPSIVTARRQRIKIAPTNEEYIRTSNIGFAHTGNSSIFGCFIGSCRYKTRSFEDFHRHLFYMHMCDKAMLTQNCLICGVFACGSSLDDELAHLLDHMSEPLVQTIAKVKEEAVIEFTEPVDMELEPAAEEAKTEADYVDMLVEPIETELTMKTLGSQEETVRINNEPEVLQTPLKTPTVPAKQALPAQSAFLDETLRVNNEPELMETLSDTKQASPTQDEPLDKTLRINNEPELLEPMNTPYKAPTLPTRQVSPAQSESLDKTLRLNSKPELLEPMETPFKAPTLPAKRASPAPVKSPKLTARKRTGCTGAFRSNSDPRPLTVDLSKVKLEPQTDPDKTIKVNNDPPMAKRRMTVSSEITPKVAPPSRKTRSVTRSPPAPVVTSNDSNSDDELDCLAFIGEKIAKASKEGDKFANFRPNESVAELFAELTRESGKRKRQEDETPGPLSKSAKLTAKVTKNSIDRYFKKLPPVKNTSTDDEDESADDEEDLDFVPDYEEFAKPRKQFARSTSSGKAPPCKPQAKSMAARTARNKAMREALEKQFEPLSDLYPWLDENFTRSVVKTKSAREILMSECCLFSTYKCMSEVCAFFTTDFEEFRKHVCEHGDANCHYCSFCLRTFEKPQELCSHIDLFHKFDRFQCGKCMYRGCQKAYVEQHQKQQHAGESCEILKSPAQKLTKAVLKKALADMSRNSEQFVPPYRCKTPRCKEVFYCKDNFRKHLKSEVVKPTSAEFTDIIYDQLKEIDHGCTSTKLEGVTQCLYCLYGTDGDDIIEHMASKHQSEFAYVCRRMMPSFVVARETLVTHTVIELLSANSTETRNYEGSIENLKSLKTIAEIKLEPMEETRAKGFKCNEIITID